MTMTTAQLIVFIMCAAIAIGLLTIILADPEWQRERRFRRHERQMRSERARMRVAQRTRRAMLKERDR